MQYSSLSGVRAIVPALAILFLFPVYATPSDAPALPQFRMRIFHTHTRERLDVVYREGDRYLPDALENLNQQLRDHRTGDVRSYDPQVFDLLHDLLAVLGKPDAEIDVVCGYRTPKTNQYLRSLSSAVAEHSLHMQALAIDIRVPGVSAAKLRDAALSLHRGGVGYYAKSNFVHVDVGRIRRW